MRRLRAEMHRRMLGNGYCARPVEMNCHFGSICESCTFFVTTIVMLSWCGSIPPIDDVIMVISCWLLALPVGPGTAGALRQIRVELEQAPFETGALLPIPRPSRQVRQQARSQERRESTTSAGPDRNPHHEGPGQLTMTLGERRLRPMMT